MNMKIIPDTKHDGFVQTNPPPRHHDQECAGGSLPRKGDNLISYYTEFKCKISGKSLLLGPFLNIVKLPRNFYDTSIIELQDAITFPCEGDRPLREPAQRRQDGPQEEERGHGAGGRARLRRRHEAPDRG